MDHARTCSRRTILGLAGLVGVSLVLPVRAAAPLDMRVFKDPGCGCCKGWIDHVRAAGFTAEPIDTADMQAVKKRLAVPHDLASCHTAEVGGYVVEGHVPASAIRQLLEQKPRAIGLAAPGMPMGSPGMEGGKPEIYEVVLFRADGAELFGRYRGSTRI